MLRCIFCIELSPDDAKFCIGCGKKLYDPNYKDFREYPTDGPSTKASGVPYYEHHQEYGTSDTMFWSITQEASWYQKKLEDINSRAKQIYTERTEKL